MAKLNETDSGKATITGSFFRVDKDTNEDFTFKCMKSKEFERNGSQSKRDQIIQKLMEQYEEKGDNIWNILNTPF